MQRPPIVQSPLRQARRPVRRARRVHRQPPWSTATTRTWMTTTAAARSLTQTKRVTTMPLLRSRRGRHRRVVPKFHPPSALERRRLRRRAVPKPRPPRPAPTLERRRRHQEVPKLRSPQPPPQPLPFQRGHRVLWGLIVCLKLPLGRLGRLVCPKLPPRLLATWARRIRRQRPKARQLPRRSIRKPPQRCHRCRTLLPRCRRRCHQRWKLPRCHRSRTLLPHCRHRRDLPRCHHSRAQMMRTRALLRRSARTAKGARCGALSSTRAASASR